MYQAFTEYHPGDAQDKHFVLQQLRSPGTATAPHGALKLLRNWLDTHERARELEVTWPMVTERYQALDGIISIALGLDEQVEFRYSLLLESLGLPDLPTTEIG